MKLSVSELSYLRTSLLAQPPLRPDSRRLGQFRPVATRTGVLPTTNGSATVRAADGSECIVGIKTKVVPTHDDLIQVSVDVVGYKDNDALPAELAAAVHQALAASPELMKQLVLTPKYGFRIFVDCMVLSFSSHPLGLISLGVFQALRDARLPRMIVADDPTDTEIDEIPQFNDDWSAAVPLCSTWAPPLLLVVAVVGTNVFVDPTQAEQQVAESVLVFTWKDSAVSAPIRTINSGSGTYSGPLLSSTLLSAYDLVESCAPQVVASL